MFQLPKYVPEEGLTKGKLALGDLDVEMTRLNYEAQPRHLTPNRA